MKKEKPLKLAGIIGAEDREDLIFTIKVSTAMIRSRNLGKLGRKLQK